MCAELLLRVDELLELSQCVLEALVRTWNRIRQKTTLSRTSLALALSRTILAGGGNLAGRSLAAVRLA